jgi:hypothetical protein
MTLNDIRKQNDWRLVAREVISRPQEPHFIAVENSATGIVLNHYININSNKISRNLIIVTMQSDSKFFNHINQKLLHAEKVDKICEKIDYDGTFLFSIIYRNTSYSLERLMWPTPMKNLANMSEYRTGGLSVRTFYVFCGDHSASSLSN